jgi:uncharacterized LabA/DUF88 family protein
MITLGEMLSSSNREMPKYKVITYIDGFNLYFGIREEAIRRGTIEAPDRRWYRYMWLNVDQLSRNMLNANQELAATKYFTAPIISSKGKQERQNIYLDSLRTVPNIQIILGRFQKDRKECNRCGHPAYHPQEKKTDVNIATHLICDALDDNFDTAIIITGDSDLVPALQTVRKLKPKKRLVVAFPPNRYSKEMQDQCHVPPIKIWEPLLRKSRFPELIKRDGLPDLICPPTWTLPAKP